MGGLNYLNKMKYKHITGYIKDCNLDSDCGRIVIYENKIMVSFIKTADHEYLINDLIAQNRLKEVDVSNEVLQLFFKYEEDIVILCGVRNIDDEKLQRNYDSYLKLIKKKI